MDYPYIVRHVVYCYTTLEFFNVKWEGHDIFEVMLYIGIGFCCLFLLIICSILLGPRIMMSMVIISHNVCILGLGFVVFLCKTCAQYCWILGSWCSWLSLLVCLLYDSFISFSKLCVGSDCMYGYNVWFVYGIIKMRACWWVWIDVYVITNETTHNT